MFQLILTAAMADKGWSPVQLAARIEDSGTRINPATIERWMDGSTEPRASLLRAAAEALGMSIDDLYPGNGAVQRKGSM